MSGSSYITSIVPRFVQPTSFLGCCQWAEKLFFVEILIIQQKTSFWLLEVPSSCCTATLVVSRGRCSLWWLKYEVPEQQPSLWERRWVRRPVRWPRRQRVPASVRELLARSEGPNMSVIQWSDTPSVFVRVCLCTPLCVHISTCILFFLFVFFACTCIWICTHRYTYAYTCIVLVLVPVLMFLLVPRFLPVLALVLMHVLMLMLMR